MSTNTNETKAAKKKLTSEKPKAVPTIKPYPDPATANSCPKNGPENARLGVATPSMAQLEKENEFLRNEVERLRSMLESKKARLDKVSSVTAKQALAVSTLQRKLEVCEKTIVRLSNDITFRGEKEAALRAKLIQVVPENEDTRLEPSEPVVNGLRECCLGKGADIAETTCDRERL